MLELINVSSGYGNNTVLHGINAKFRKGLLVSVIGPNGCGKSTLLKTLAGIIKNTDGAIIADSIPTKDIPPRELAKKIAYLGQDRSTPDMTVSRLVLHGRFPHLSYPRIYTARDREIASLAMKKTETEHLADRRLSTLSGGTRQRVYIAMALCQCADFILLDEPATYLDSHRQMELMQTLKSLASDGRSIVAVMHDLPLAMHYSDMIAVMDSGRLMAFGAPSEIISSGILSDVFGIDIGKSKDGDYFCKYN